MRGVALHKLGDGRDLIEDLVLLGKALGYVVREELPVEPRADAPAVDVAWFRDGESRYPLFLLEVESLASNTMANNAVKVFSQSSTAFEKPLFFFHLVAKAGRRSSRMGALQQMFGSHNYRLYALDDDHGTAFVRDVLSQHRRLSNSLAVGAVLEANRNQKQLVPDLNDVLHHAWTLGLRGAYLRDCAMKAASTGLSDHAQAYISLVQRHRADSASSPDTGYASYLGHRFEEPIHSAMLAGRGTIDDRQAAEEILRWQGSESAMRQLGPYFGLARDYDELIRTLAGPVWALIVGIARRSPGVVNYAAEQLGWLVHEIRRARDRIPVFTAAWGLHVAASAKREDLFQTCSDVIAGYGGLRREALFMLPGFLDYETENAWPELSVGSSEVLPSMAELSALRAAIHQERHPSATTTAMRALTEEGYPGEWGADLLALVAHGGEA
jgi:hypothetical protein